MPLASSREASRKRAEKVAAERKERQRRQRLSLPSTISSSTVVNESKARRRLSRQHSGRLSIASITKENDAPENPPPKSPGPTPYWKIAQERGGQVSPRLTRSHSKKKKDPPVEQKGNGVILNFSPPDQEANAREEQARIAAQEQDRAHRVQNERDNGQLLVFSPSNRPLPMETESEGADDKNVDLSLPDPDPTGREVEIRNDSSTSKDSASQLTDSQVSITGETSKEMTATLKTLREYMEEFQNKSNGSDEDAKQAKQLMMEVHDTFAATNRKLEQKNEELQAEIKDSSAAWRQEKDEYLVKTTRLESELEASKREATAQVDVLKEVQQKLENQVATLQEDKTEQLKKVHNLEQQVALANSELEESKNKLQAMRLHNESEKEVLQTDTKHLEEANANLSKELEAIEKARSELERRVDEYERVIENLENHVLPESKAQLEEALQQLQTKEECISELQDKLSGFENVIDGLKEEVSALNAENEGQRDDFQALNEQSSKAFDKLTEEASEKDQKIGELFRQLGETQKEIQKNQQGWDETSNKLAKVQHELSAQNTELTNALEETMTQLDECEQAKRVLERRISELEKILAEERQNREMLDTELTETKEQLKVVEEERNHVRSNMQGLSEKEEELYQKIHEMEYQMRAKEEEHRRELRHTEQLLKTSNQERDDARNNMQGFNAREAELYRKLQESDRIRRDLHSRVMQLAGNIRVYVRVRPALPGEFEKEQAESAANSVDSKKRKREEDEQPFRFPGIYERDNKKSSVSSSGADDLTKNIIVAKEPYKDRGGLSDRRKVWKFGFDHVFSPQHGQDDVWEATEPLVQSAVDGYNVTIFAYGQTGSGKTYTMLGDTDNPGIIGRSVAKLFEAKSEMEQLSRGESKVALSVELLEVYNEQVRDLLAPNGGPNGRELPLKVTSKEVVGNVRVPTSTEQEVMRVLAVAQNRRCVKATASNSESSRSHMLFTIHFDVTMKDGVTRSGKLNVCDLAGSERLGKSGAHIVGGSLLQETKHINKSLSVLSNVIERLQTGDKNVPFRESKLTFLLQNSLGGNSKTLAIVCCNPLYAHFHESLCSLRFAEKVNKVDLKAVANFSC